MITIKNINDIWGDPVTFTAETVSEAVREMEDSLRASGYDVAELREGVDYEVQGEVYIAEWDGDRYAVPSQGWCSSDGDNWSYEDGALVLGSLFERARITLSGGPRNGEVVA